MTMDMSCLTSESLLLLSAGDDQQRNGSTVVPPGIRPRRRYLEDPLPLPVSNYYTIYPTSRSVPPMPMPRRQTTSDEIVCDLFNLLERRPPPIKPRRVHLLPKPDERFPSIHHYSELKAKRNIPRWISQGYSARKGFFRRVVRDYLCIPMPRMNSDYSN